MPFPVSALRWQAPFTAADWLAVFIYVIVGPMIGLVAFRAAFGRLGDLTDVGPVYLIGGGPAAVCAVLSLLAARRWRAPWRRLLAAPAIGLVSGLVGIVPALVFIFGAAFRSGDLSFVWIAFGFSAALSLIASTLCTAIIESLRANGRRAFGVSTFRAD